MKWSLNYEEVQWEAEVVPNKNNDTRRIFVSLFLFPLSDSLSIFWPQQRLLPDLFTSRAHCGDRVRGR